MVNLTTEKIDVEALLSEVEDPGTGGVVLFLGRVRDHAEGRNVEKMDYQAYAEMAVAKMQEIENYVREQWPAKQVAIVHRTGELAIGEVSVAIAVACAHRKDAFAACRYAIDRLKETAPIWKKEYFANGSAWVDGVIPKTS